MSYILRRREYNIIVACTICCVVVSFNNFSTYVSCSDSLTGEKINVFIQMFINVVRQHPNGAPVHGQNAALQHPKGSPAYDIKVHVKV